MLTVGTPVDNPAATDVLVTSLSVNTPRRYKVRVTIASEVAFWATLTHRGSGAGAKSSLLIPVNVLLGPVEIYETYFANGDYVEVSVRAGAVTLVGTVQATVELL
jgi:hypothetical protein